MNIPEHVAIIMDGNGRWAKLKGLPRVVGHKQGAERFRQIVKSAKQKKIKVVTVFAFSSENWVRPKLEKEFLFGYMTKFLRTYKDELVVEGVALRIIGRRDRIPAQLKKAILDCELATADNSDFFLNVAIDYGGRWDILEATKKVAYDLRQHKLSEKNLDEKYFRKYLALGDFKDPDLLIRTSGEQRISNFMIWDTAYSELYFTKTFWPDFDDRQLQLALNEYARRERKFGGVEPLNV